ncbi:MAG: aminotransferase class III-fold pyridoxal phosphate-dependent enzyme [Planctomycetales bacterium]|nr:aminotransferase class III-fold pyridoxal phosphate-dependent enzyme [Planctomycetales bacterium]NIM09091.1 aminotransferase class III-fold pyridoxal phosphate-dependent enzyme [Planctomycetales bacterium]NIN08551.1 aminotransferase class III-fold pyridoxal phosphate-dependent enzyme [Planctomycetales bacterium]NIN77684.1 aminotransferase class III-fold pyridoxal phosphate-dependent enzyme [Planctomycetales bacterium]NIO34849.1 aminotransferase class III-fold pyridoxal phosphate-dependent en
MKFAFLVHPLSRASRTFFELEDRGTISNVWGRGNLFELSSQVQGALAISLAAGRRRVDCTTVIDELRQLRSPSGRVAEGRLYEIPLDAHQILADPDRAMGHAEAALQMAADWGAGIVGLGSLTGVIGGQGSYLARHSPVPVTTGNSLTVFAALRNLEHVCAEAGLNLAHETVAIIGVPGSIATAAARILAPEVGRLLLVSRRATDRVHRLAASLGATAFDDIATALSQARIILSATSTGGCIDQFALQPSSVVVDVGVPADVYGRSAQRDDVLIISGGVTEIPEVMGRDSVFLQFHFGMIPACLGETINLALEGRDECFSLGRDLSSAKIEEIGKLAMANGFRFDRLLSFGQPLEESMWANFLKVTTQRGAAWSASAAASGCGGGEDPSLGQQAAARPPGPALAGVVPAIAELAASAAKRYRRYVNPVIVDVAGQAGLARIFVRGEGNYLWDESGRKYLDFVAGFGSLNLGHNHPRVVAAITKSLQQLAPGFAQSAINPHAAALAERLVAVAPQGLEMVFFCNSGTEAVEAALKLARRTSDRQAILSCEGAYHGKTFGSLSVTGNDEYQRPFRPLLPDCRRVPYGDVAALERALGTRQFAAFVVEPIQGEGGMVVPPAGYLSKAQTLCRENQTLLIVDEVQTGMGRTGAMFACQHEGVEPDVIAVAKSLGGGLMPIGATLARRDLWRRAYGTLDSFALHTSTFGGGSLACAAALATLQTLTDTDLIQNATQRGQQLIEGLREIQAQTGGYIRQVRGMGLMIGVELAPLTESVAAHIKRADPAGMIQYLSRHLDEIVETLPAIFQMQTLFEKYGIYSQVTRSRPLVLRVQPSLTIEASMVDQFLAAFAESCKAGMQVENVFDVMITRSVSGHHDGQQAAGGQADVDLGVSDDSLGVAGGGE